MSQVLRDRPRSDQQPDDERPDDADGSQRSLAQWITVGLSTLIVLSLVGLLLYQAVAGGSQPPAIEVKFQHESLRQAGALYYLPVEVTNQGDQTAQDVRVRLSYMSDQGQPELAEVMTDFLAGGATDHHTVALSREPSGANLKVDSVTFREP